MSSILKEVWAQPKSHDPLELTRLYRTIEEGLDRRSGCSVAITSPHNNDQVLRLAYDLAWVGSTLLGKRVLVLDTTGQAYSPPVIRTWNRPGRAAAPTSAATKPASAASQALVDVEGALREPNRTGLLTLSVSGGKDVGIMPQLSEIWGRLQGTFDMIVVAAPPVLEDPTAACLGEVVGGSVLLVSSGASRQKEVTRAIELLTSGATPLLGIVMTDRRHSLPGWLRRFFGSD